MDASFGPASKKPPPLKGGDVTWGAAVEDRWLATLMKFAKGCDLGSCWGFGPCGGDTGGLKLRLLNASSKPPKLEVECCCSGGDCIPPNEGWRSCCGCCWGCGFGAEAYNDKMDCLRSGLEEPVEPAGVDDTLGGLIPALDGPPKKSSPSSESAALEGFVGAVALRGGGRAPGVSVVLGLAGGSGTSPKRSTGGAGFGAAGAG